MVELRRHARTPIDIAVEIVAKGSTERRLGRATDLSVGGVYVVAADPFPFSTEVVVQMLAPRLRAPVAIPGVVRWNRAGGMGIQFGLLGARETHAITEAMKG